MSRKPCIFSSTIASVLEGLAFICFSLVDRQSVSRFSQSPLNTKHNKHTYIHIYVNAYLCISMYSHAYIHTQGTYYQCVFFIVWFAMPTSMCTRLYVLQLCCICLAGKFGSHSGKERINQLATNCILVNIFEYLALCFTKILKQ